MKESFYFQHDYDALNDPKIQALISEFKAEGYGIYWAVIELLHKEQSHRLPLKNYIYSAIAKQMSTSVEQVENLLKYAIDECELFTEEDGFFYSNRVLRNFEKREEIIEKRRLAGQKSAFLRSKGTSVQQNSTSVEQNPTKEKKYKRKETDIIYTEKNDSDVTESKPEKKITRREPETHPVNDFIKKEYPDTIAKMPVQMTAQHCDKIVKEYGAEYVKKVFARMDSWEPLNRKRKDVYRTFQTFAINGNEKK